MKRRLTLLTLLPLLILSVAAQQPTPRELFERARILEESNRSLDEAIALYGEAASQSGDRELAATAHLRVGLLQERRGRLSEAERAFRIVASEFADQIGAARQAQLRLARIARPPATPVSEPVLRRIFADELVDPAGSPSPDGRYLSVVDWTTGDLAVRDVRTGATRRVTDKGAWTESQEHAESSIFSPDGRQLAYVWFNSELAYDIRTVRVDGGPARVLYRNAEARVFYLSQWSPDGRSILALVALKDGSSQIALISVPDGSLRVLKSISWSGVMKMGFSPDGRFIAYHAPREGASNRDIFILASDGTVESAAVEHPADDLFLGWAPDGRQILFASDRTDPMSAWRLPVGNGKPQGTAEIVKRNLGRVWPMGVAANGAYFFGLENSILDVVIHPFNPATGRVDGTPLTMTQRFVALNLSPEFSPDGRHVLYVSKRTAGPPFGQQVITIQSLETGEARGLVPELGYVGRVRWSPDGTSLLVTGRDRKNREGIYRIDSRDGTTGTLLLGDPGSPVRAPGWSPDGKALFFLRTDDPSKRVRIVRRQIDTGDESEIHRIDPPRIAQRMAISPDARHVALIVNDTASRSSSLEVVPVSGGNARTLVRVQPPEALFAGYDILAWSPDGRHIFFARSSTALGRHTLWRVGLETGIAEPLGLAAVGISGVAVHPDGVRLAVVSGEFKGEIWVMENVLSGVVSAGPARRQQQP